MAKKITEKTAKEYLKKVGAATDGFEIAYVCEDGNVFTNEDNCNTHASSRKLKYFEVKL